ncbi:acetyl-CoA carboxylase carboxyltransferase subunit alpha [Paraclostridium bifermentans]|uniref:Acetyl-coenzyme A carboxylase carboxyl transferase subunit alpha n=1 Tax=Paraclostridium bifermentans ATCC 638 = DSM 14991 TaxID=1233171 RepID=T4VMV4_PARBF|nr:acetyl-CoA carboxylase carboxyltransferase subunit alpha [Paraclostridium bifermentans]EQK42823.1 acetyl-CoA carboxylase, carboxyl transferase, alpha subunit [[Clostridium] bifermentans ATCC 638] [Paraclostridium bifermentans ATCC 638 = DSM 14991]MDU3802857.1 acetyl-CoA carboxylase carboxyltransferase subunit alpha [Paraclostridium bifermentans]
MHIQNTSSIEDINKIKESIKQLKQLSNQSNIDLSCEIEKLEMKLKNIETTSPKDLSAWDKVSISRDIKRPNAENYIKNICSLFIELHGDRLYKDDPSIIGGIGKIGDFEVTLIGHQKGKDINEQIKRNFGMPHPEGYRKALRLMKQAEKFNRPIITFIDTPGAFCGIEAEERGQGEAIAKNLLEMSSLKVPILSIVIGEGGSGGALGIGVSNEIAMLQNSVYSVISPEGLSSILFKDASKSKDASEIMKLTSSDLKDLGIIDHIIEEPPGTAHSDLEAVSNDIKDYIINRLSFYKDFSKDEIVNHRYGKFRNIGVY